MLTILLIRHGESLTNAGEPTSCPHSVELTDKGWKEAEAIAQLLQEAQLTPDLIVTSSYLRTKQTAEPTRVTFPSIPQEEWPVHEFTYLSSWHESSSTIEDRRPAVQAYWNRSDPSYVDGSKPGSESFEQFIARVRKVKEQLEQSALDIIALFSHEQFMNAFRCLPQNNPGELSSETMREFRAFLEANPIRNGAIVKADFQKGYADWRYEMITSHLNEMQLVSTKR